MIFFIKIQNLSTLIGQKKGESMSLKNKTVETEEKQKDYEKNKEKLLNLIFSVFPKDEEEMVKFYSLTIEEQVEFLYTEIRKLGQPIPSSEEIDAFGFHG